MSTNAISGRASVRSSDCVAGTGLLEIHHYIDRLKTLEGLGRTQAQNPIHLIDKVDPADHIVGGISLEFQHDAFAR
jgi:hypothetical protein